METNNPYEMMKRKKNQAGKNLQNCCKSIEQRFKPIPSNSEVQINKKAQFYIKNNERLNFKEKTQ